MKRNASSSIIAEVILIAVTLIASAAVYEIVVQKGLTFQSGASVQITGAGFQSFGNGQGLLTVTVTNTAGVPEFAGVYLSGLPATGGLSEPGVSCGNEADGYIYYTAVNIKSGSYTFNITGDECSTILVKGPSTGYSWESLTGEEYMQGNFTVNLQGGTYQIVVVSVNVCGSGYSYLRSNLPASTWLVTLYHMPVGDSYTADVDGKICVAPPFSELLANPLNLTGYGAEAARVQVLTGNAFSGNYSNLTVPYAGSAIQPAIPVGLLMPGQSVTYSWIIDGGWDGVPHYFTGQSLTVYVEAWTMNGSRAMASSGIEAG